MVKEEIVFVDKEDRLFDFTYLGDDSLWLKVEKFDGPILANNYSITTKYPIIHYTYSIKDSKGFIRTNSYTLLKPAIIKLVFVEASETSKLLYTR